MRTAGIVGFLGVALGAFGAHALKDWLLTLPDGAERMIWWEKAVHYHLVHAVFLVAAGVWSSTTAGAPARGPLLWSTRLATAGIALFSGSLYVMTLSGIRILGAVTPLGGLCFLGAWALLFVAGTRASNPQR